MSDWEDLFWSTTAMMSDIERSTLPSWISLPLGNLPDDSFRILTEKMLWGKEVEHPLKRAAKPNPYQSNPEKDARDAADIKALRVWFKILTVPDEELPTLIGVREDLDELIAERLKSETTHNH